MPKNDVIYDFASNVKPQLYSDCWRGKPKGYNSNQQDFPVIFNNLAVTDDGIADLYLIVTNYLFKNWSFEKFKNPKEITFNCISNKSTDGRQKPSSILAYLGLHYKCKERDDRKQWARKFCNKKNINESDFEKIKKSIDSNKRKHLNLGYYAMFLICKILNKETISIELLEEYFNLFDKKDRNTYWGTGGKYKGNAYSQTNTNHKEMRLNKKTKNYAINDVSLEYNDNIKINESAQLVTNKSWDDYEPKPKNVPKKTNNKSKKNRYKTKLQVKINALNFAKHKCEYCDKHKTFIRKKDGTPYTEAHHLIPISKQNDFKKSLDVEANVVSLCSNCHNEIHYGKNAERIIKKLHKKRATYLEKTEIYIEVDDLLCYYGIYSN